MSAIQFPESGVEQVTADDYKPCSLQLIRSISSSIAASKHMFMQQPILLYNGIAVARY